MDENKDNIVLQTTDQEGLIKKLNVIEDVFSDTFPLVFRAVDKDGKKGVIHRAGIDYFGNFIWTEEENGTILFVNVALWEETRIVSLFKEFLPEEQFEILEGSFTGEYFTQSFIINKNNEIQ